MRIFRYIVLFFLFVAPAAALSAIGPGDLPETSKWYFHADFEQMRSTEGGQLLYAWLRDEVLEEIREEAGVDLDEEADTLTAFSTEEEGLIVLIEGNISQATEDKTLAMGAVAGGFDKLESGGKTYYHAKDGQAMDGDDDNIDIDIDSFDDGAFFSFAIKNKLIVTTSEENMQSMLADEGRVTGVESGDGALFVLRAERSLVQAGANTGSAGKNVDWDSNILRNTKQAALVVAEKDGKIAIEAQLVTAEKEMADSLASIVRGLISLQVFNDDIDPEITEFLQNTTVEVNDSTLTVKVVLDPEVIVAVID